MKLQKLKQNYERPILNELPVALVAKGLRE